MQIHASLQWEVIVRLPIGPQPCEHSLTFTTANMSHSCALTTPACRYASAKRWQCHYPGDQETEGKNYYQPHAKSFPLIKSALRFQWRWGEGGGETSWQSREAGDRLKEPDPDLLCEAKLVYFNKIKTFWAMMLWNALQTVRKSKCDSPAEMSDLDWCD